MAKSQVYSSWFVTQFLPKVITYFSALLNSLKVEEKTHQPTFPSTCTILSYWYNGVWVRDKGQPGLAIQASAAHSLECFKAAVAERNVTIDTTV